VTNGKGAATTTTPHHQNINTTATTQGAGGSDLNGDDRSENLDRLKDLFLYLDVCCDGDSTPGWLHVAVGYNPHFDENGAYRHTRLNGRPGLEPRPFRWPDEAGVAMDFILAESAKADVWVCPNLMRRDWICTIDPKTNREIRKTGRSKGDAVARFTVHADADGQVDIEKVKAIEGAFAVASGSPGHAHVYVRLSDPTITSAQHDTLSRGLGAHVVGVDADCKFSDNDLLRAPGTLNHKAAARGGEPTPVTWLVKP
jgi:putative DNA primase/helicase